MKCSNLVATDGNKIATHSFSSSFVSPLYQCRWGSVQIHDRICTFVKAVCCNWATIISQGYKEAVACNSRDYFTRVWTKLTPVSESQYMIWLTLST
jgi:hypothetical protein